MKVLVTGGGGFLGEYIVEQLLARGDSVRILARNDYPHLTAQGVDVVRGDIRDSKAVSQAVRGCSVVFHVASLPGISVHRRPFYLTNVLGTQHVIDACLTYGVEKLIYTGSPSVTDSGQPQEGVDETAPYPTRFLAHYPETKAIAEKMVLVANGKESPLTGQQLLTCSLRPRLIWGPRDRHLIPRLLDRARSGRLIQVGDGTNRLDTIYVENAATAHLLAADALTAAGPVAGNAYYLSQGEPVNCWDWINTLLAKAKLPPVKRKISLGTAWLLGSVLESGYWLFRLRSEPPMTRFLATQLAQSYWFNIDKSRRDFGYSPIISTAEGLERMNFTD